ncbi:ComEC/Rec2 family competence protein [Hoeflea sp.]|uniref:ComEC/Rec2 family competence protein n=1 Tax=Hoeflea sp. TaxID=1940281 RepID=UPI003748D28D
MGLGAGLFFMAVRDPPVAALIAGLLISGVIAFSARSSNPGLARAGGLFAAMFVGALAAANEIRDAPVLLDSDVTTQVRGVVEAREFDADGRVRYLLRVSATSDPQIRRPPTRVRLVARTAHTPALVGALIEGRARLSTPSGPVLPGGYDFAFRAFVDGIGAHGFFFQAPRELAPAQLEGGIASKFRQGLREMREDIAARVRSVLPGDAGGIAAALTVSDRRGITKPTVEALRATGLAHILAISGLHMALAAGLLYVGLRLIMAGFPALVEGWPVKKLAAAGALVTATAYLAISGGSIPTQRAWVMLSIMLIAVVLDRPALTIRNVALAAIVIIVLSPSAVVGPGFQMSFAATAALIAAYAALSRRKADRDRAPASVSSMPIAPAWTIWLFKAALGLAITSLVAGLATGLFSAHHFHRVAGNGLLANLLAMPLVTLVVMPAGLLAMLLMPFGLDQLPLQAMGAGLRGVIAVANHVNEMGGDILIGQIPLHATALAGAGFIALVFLRSRLRLAGFVLIGLGALLALPPLAPDRPQILISEDGRLVGLYGAKGLASNAKRPSAFVFGQWQTALGGPAHLPPAMLRPRGEDPETPDTTLSPLLEGAISEPSRFHCAARGICAARQRGATIIAIDRPELIGPACDRADLVVVSIPVYMSRCRSGATLVTARSLRRTGALGIRIEHAVQIDGDVVSVKPLDPMHRNTSAVSTVATSETEHPAMGAMKNTPRPRLRINEALEGGIRPWTVQRYYDWRSRSYDLPD